MDDKAILETVHHLFKVRANPTDHCLEPTERCEKKAIRAHSIPSGTVLKRLVRDGHVVAPKMKLKMPPPAEIEFGLVGRKNASTFSGLCGRHDNDIFRPIDDALPDLTEPKHLFLLSYRAVLREFYVVLQNAVQFQSIYQKRIEVGLSPRAEPCRSGMIATAHLRNAFESYEYKRNFDATYLAGNWDDLEHHVLILKDQRQSIATSSMFSLDGVDAPETPRATLSIFPVDTDVAVVFSAIPADAAFVKRHLERLLASESCFQKYLLSKLVLQSCENFVIDPDYYDSLSEERKDAILNFFVATMFDNAEDREDEQLYLF